MRGFSGPCLQSTPASIVTGIARATVSAFLRCSGIVRPAASSGFLLLVFIFGVAPLFAQGPQNPSAQGVIRITVNLVQVDAVVTDSKGRQITNLTPDKFEIFEDGHRQTITNFSYIPLTAPPGGEAPPQPAQPGAPYIPPARLRPEQVRRTIVVVVDDLHLSFEDTVYVREALKKFVDDDIQPGDLVAIVRTSSGIGVLQQFTNDKRLLYAAVARVRYYLSGGWGLKGGSIWVPEGLDLSDLTRPAVHQGDPGKASEAPSRQERDFRRSITTAGTLGTLDYVLKGLRDLPGRKSVVILSDQIPVPNVNPSLVWEKMRELADLANRSSAVLYMIDARGLPTLEFNAEEGLASVPTRSSPGGIANMLMNRRAEFSASQAVMSFLANQTGGIYVHNNNDLARGMREVMDDLEGYYLIGFKPLTSTFKESSKGGAYHRIMVKVKGRGLHVRSRMGFYGVPDKEARPAQLMPAAQLRAAVVSPFGASGIRVEIAPQFLYRGAKNSVARLWLHVDGPDVTLQDGPDGKKKGTLDALALVFGDNGVVAGASSGAFHASLLSDQLDALRREGVNYHLDIPVQKPGGYQLRMAVRDPVSQKVGSASQFIEVPDLRKRRLALSGIVLNPDALGDKGPAVRRFHAGDRVSFQLEIYNARHGKDGEAPDLEATLRVFREGQIISTQTREMTGHVPLESQPLVISGEFTISGDMVPGHYALQATVTDRLSPKNESVASRWIDFEVVSPEVASPAR
jgi:VWFA-related protein